MQEDKENPMDMYHCEGKQLCIIAQEKAKEAKPLAEWNFCTNVQPKGDWGRFMAGKGVFLREKEQTEMQSVLSRDSVYVVSEDNPMIQCRRETLLCDNKLSQSPRERQAKLAISESVEG